MVKILCPQCNKDDKWEVYEVLNDPRTNYRVHCFNCGKRFVLPKKNPYSAEEKSVDAE